jgi:glycogenin
MAPHSAPDAPSPQSPTTTVEEPVTERSPDAEVMDQGIIEPVPTTEQRRFSAPKMEWDATQYEKLLESTFRVLIN